MCFKIEVTLFKELRAVVYQCDDRDENEHHNGHNDESNHNDLQWKKLILDMLIFRKKEIIPNSCSAQIYLGSEI